MTHQVHRALTVGDRVRVLGGYDMDPAWLAASPLGYEGKVIGFVSAEAQDEPAAIVALEQELVLPKGAGTTSDAIAGSFLVLTLGHVGTDWSTPSPRVHVSLCTAPPTKLPWSDEMLGSAWWVESHATYRILN